MASNRYKKTRPRSRKKAGKRRGNVVVKELNGMNGVPQTNASGSTVGEKKEVQPATMDGAQNVKKKKQSKHNSTSKVNYVGGSK